MNRLRNSKAGFTMVELLVVLIIVAVLAAVATPIYLANIRRARASEAVGAMGLIRQALRDYNMQTGSYNIDTNNIELAPPNGVDVDVGVVQYFSNAAYSIDPNQAGTDGDSDMFDDPAVQDFLISVDGDDSEQCSGSTDINCAVKAEEVDGTNGDPYLLEMDNSGRVYVSYDDGTTWSAY